MATRSRLAVILHADIVGSSALVQIDERVAHERIRDAFKKASEVITRYAGATHELRGDAMLAEFQRASDAVTSALAIQAENTERNNKLTDDIRPLLRVGIALGEVVIADDTVTGPGVVLAQRLEQLANPGGVCVQSSVQESVPTRFPFDYEDLGDQSLKGFDKSVRASRVVIKANEHIPSPDLGPSRAQDTSRPHRHWLAGASVALVLVSAGLVAWLDSWSGKPASSEQPSIAVLAFSNLSDDPQQDYFAEGIAEDLITDLSKIPNLIVIARNSSFSYKGKNVPIRTVARELGVEYVLEGSVRRAGGALRINAQLIDTTTDGHLWAERYDGNLKEVFAFQDRITKKIVAALSIKLSAGSSLDLEKIPTVVPEAYDAFLRGMRYLNARDYGDSVAIVKAREAFQQAVDLDPDFAQAYAGLGWVNWNDHIFVNQLDYGLRRRAFDLANKSLELADNSLARRLRAKQFFAPESVGHFAAARGKKPTDAVSELRKSVALEPNNADGLAELAYTLVFAGQPEEASVLVRKAMRLNPNFPAWYHRPAGIAHYLSGDYSRAVSEFKAWHDSEALPMQSIPWLAAAYAQAGEIPSSRNVIKKFAKRYSDRISQQYVANWYVFVREEDRKRFMDGLGKAGIRDALAE